MLCTTCRLERGDHLFQSKLGTRPVRTCLPCRESAKRLYEKRKADAQALPQEEMLNKLFKQYASWYTKLSAAQREQISQQCETGAESQ